MLPFRRILFPIDFSESCQSITPHVAETASRFASEITLIHAFEMPAAIQADDEIRKSEESRLQQFAKEAFPAMHVECLVEAGEPGSVICGAVQRHGIDLVMMPTQGRGGFRRLLLGSITAKVLHDVSAAVWTGVHAAISSHSPQVPYRSILCALNTDEEAPDLVKAAGAIANSYSADLSFVHVVETPPGSWEVDFAPYRKELMDAADLKIRSMARAAGIDPKVIVLHGSISGCIRQEVTERQADLLIVGRGRSQGVLSRIWSSLYETVREAPCPVLSI